MNTIQLCFGLCFSNNGSQISENIKEQYQNTYKKIFSFICSHPDFRMTLFIPGVILDWLKKNRPEIITILTERIEAGQIELLGGGFYEPIFPLILPADRVAQIEKLTTTIRKYIGKKPRGLFLNESIWDPSLISTCNSSSMEYTFLDYRLIPQHNYNPLPTFIPHIVEELGRTLSVVPLHQEFLPTVETDIDNYIESLHNIAEKNNKGIVAAFFNEDDLIELITSKWFDSFLAKIQNDEAITVNFAYNYLKNNNYRQISHIQSGCIRELAIWAVEPCVKHTEALSNNAYPTVKDFLSVYNEAFNLYARLMYTTSLIHQCRGDKARKNAARESLFKAQNYSSFIFKGKGGIRDKKLLRESYKNLIEAECLYREASNFTENTISLDFTHDGNKEYLCSFEQFNAFISLFGGMVFELDIIANETNYCLGSKRKGNIDTDADSYAKKMFVDHLLTEKCFNEISTGQTCSTSSFPSLQYTETTYSRTKSIIQLRAECLWGKDKIPVSLRKNYKMSENGIHVQYILKNESEKHLKARFAVENNISFNNAEPSSVKAEILTSENKEEASIDEECIYNGDVSLVRLRDNDTNTEFIFELNEECSYSMQPYFTRQLDNDNNYTLQYEAHTCIFYWNIDLPPGLETEKSIWLNIKPNKKKVNIRRRK